MIVELELASEKAYSIASTRKWLGPDSLRWLDILAQGVYVNDGFPVGPIDQISPVLASIDSNRIDTEIRIWRRTPFLEQTRSWSPELEGLALGAVAGQLGLGDLVRAPEGEAPDAAALAEEPVQLLLGAMVVAQLRQRVERREQREIFRRVLQAQVQDAGLVADGAVAAVHALHRGSLSRLRGFGGRVEVDDVFHVATVAGPSVWAASLSDFGSHGLYLL